MLPGSKLVARLWRSTDKAQCTHLKYTHGYTTEERTILLEKPMLWANDLGIFSQPPAHRRPLDTERRRRFAPTSAPHY